MALVLMAAMCAAAPQQAHAAKLPKTKIEHIWHTSKTTAVVQVKVVKGAKKYQYQYALDKKFKKSKKTKTSKKNNVKIKKLKTGVKYYLRARAVSGKKKGPWSKVKTTTISRNTTKLDSYTATDMKTLIASSTCTHNYVHKKVSMEMNFYQVFFWKGLASLAEKARSASEVDITKDASARMICRCDYDDPNGIFKEDYLYEYDRNTCTWRDLGEWEDHEKYPYLGFCTMMVKNTPIIIDVCDKCGLVKGQVTKLPPDTWTIIEANTDDAKGSVIPAGYNYYLLPDGELRMIG